MLRCQKADFEIPDDVTFLNAAYVSPISRLTRLAGERGVARKSRPWDIGWSNFHSETDVARAEFARLIGANPDDIAIVPAVSYGVQVAARNLEFTKGGRVVVLGDQFPSNFYAWRDLARARGGYLDILPCPDDWAWTDALLGAITTQTQIVALPQHHWTNGVRIDLDRVSVRCREVGAALVLDLSQSLGAVPFSVSLVQPDFVVCASYKWLLGPYSLAFLYAAPHRQSGVPLEAHQWSRINALAPPEWRAGLTPYPDEYLGGARRYDMGERANFALMPMAISAMSRVSELEPRVIADYLKPLVDRCAEAAETLGAERVPPPRARGPHMIGFRPPAHLQPDQLQRRLMETGVFVSVRGGNLRVSPHIYNDAADIDRLTEVLETAR